MRKLLSLAAIGALLSVSFVSSADEAQAAALTNLVLDCDSAASIALANATITGAAVGDTFKIQNVGSAFNCDITDSGSVLTGEPANVVTGTTSGDIVIAKSGTFTIASSTDSIANSFVVDVCSLTGAGVASDPWLVGNQADFQIVGVQGTSGESYCSLSGHYLQTADLTNLQQLDDYTNDKVGSSGSPFTGTYDGDHYRISLGGTDSAGWNYDNGGSFSSRTALFEYVSGATIKKVRVSGNIKSNAAFTGGLVGEINGSAVVSEVYAGVNIESIHVAPSLGGVVARAGTPGNFRIQYSKSSSDISWNPAGLVGNRPRLGGVVGYLPDGGTATKEIRDTYFNGGITIDSTGHGGANIYVGGIVGEQDDEPAILVRTYSTGSASDECVGAVPAVCADSADNLRAGALTGTSQTGAVYLGNFFLRSGLFQAAFGSGTQPADYTGGGEPEAVPLSASQLKTISTYQSLESSAGSGLPSGDADLPASSDARWAIEPITAQTFVPSSYDASSPVGVDEGSAAEIAVYTNRVAYADTSVSREYRTLRAGVLSAHGGEEAATVVNYPDLGRVWDICDDYPTLVWEENNSCTGSGGSSSSSSSTDASANPGGLSDAEYAEYLASGLTLEQFLAPRLAATGVPSSALSLGFGAMLAFLGLGVALVWVNRRERVAGRL